MKQQGSGSSRVEFWFARLDGPYTGSIGIGASLLAFFTLESISLELGVEPASDMWQSVTAAYGIGFLSYVLLVGVVRLARLKAPGARIAAFTAVYAIATSVRSLGIDGAFWPIDRPTPPVWYTVASASTTGIVLFSIAVTLFNLRARFRGELARLGALKVQRAKSAALLAADIAEQREQLVERIRTLLSSSIRAAVRNVTEERDLADRWLDVSNTVVRPLSHALQSGSLPIETPQSRPEARVTSARTLELAVTGRPLRALPLVCVAFVLYLPDALLGGSASPALSVLVLALSMVAVWVLMEGVGFGLSRWFGRAPIFLRAGIVLTALFLIGTIVPFVVWPFIAPPPEDLLLASAYLGLVTTAVGAMLAIWRGLSAARSEVIRELTDHAAELERANVRLALTLWSEQQQLARAVHRDVQSSLIAAAMRLRATVAAGGDVAAIADEMTRYVLSQVEDLRIEQRPDSLEAGLFSLRDKWDGVCRVHVAVTDDATGACTEDEIASRALVELAAEAVTNAVKHGRAANAWVHVDAVGLSELSLSVVNDGTPLVGSPTPGLGTSVRLAEPWRIRLDGTGDGQVRFTARVPLVAASEIEECPLELVQAGDRSEG